MENTLLNSLKEETNYKYTENGAVAHKTTLNAIYDMFAFGGAYRQRSDADCIMLFKQALEENEELALKCLFYLRDIRGGQGERRFFRVCFNWLAKNYPELAFRNLDNIPEYGRWDDLYCVKGTEIENDALDLIACQLKRDMNSLKTSNKEGVSLLAKWLKSENAASLETKRLAKWTREYLGWGHAKYRKTLSALRERIRIVETLMSQNRWDEIEFDKIPSRAGMRYRNLFAHKDITAARYAEFMSNKETKVNAATLYPYDIVKGVTNKIDYSWNRQNSILEETERNALNKYWANQPDYLKGKPCKALCVVDTSGSMTCAAKHDIKPIDIAISLGMYCAERIGEPFNNYYISFASRPQLIKIDGIDFCDKVQRIYQANLVDNTNLSAVFDLILDIAITKNLSQDELPEQLIIISDMEVDGSYSYNCINYKVTEMNLLRAKWATYGYKLPNIIYWNVNARHDTILDDTKTEGVTFVSGCSPVLFESVLSGKSGKDIMLDKLNSERYKNVK